MKAYYGIDHATGKWYAMTDLPKVTQWGQTAKDAQRKLSDYLLLHHSLMIVNWSEFPTPNQKKED